MELDWVELSRIVKEGGGELLGESYPAGKKMLHFRCLAVQPQGGPCGKEFTRLYQEAMKPKRMHRFICRPCCNLARRAKSRIGLKHSGYRADMPLSDRYKSRALRGLHHKMWAQAVRALHGQRCAVTGNYAQNTQVHHIESWEGAPHLRFMLDNGVPLLPDLHREFHYEYEPSLGLKRGKAGYQEFVQWFSAKTGRSYEPLFSTLRVEMIFPSIQDRSEMLRKKEELHKQGILYVPIYPFEARTKMPILGSMFRNRQGSCERRVGARSLQLVRLKPLQAKAFFDQCHIQGYTSAGVALGLSDGEEILCAALFSRSRTPNGKFPDAHELVRFASKLDTVVQGGASKLLNAYTRLASPSRIVTFADIRFCQFDPGQTMYPRLGFVHSHTIPPGYAYTDANGSTLLNKKQFQRKHLSERLGESFDPALSERENMEKAGYQRLYDCGKYAFVLECDRLTD